MRLEGKTVVVTGASSGMGHAGDESSYVNGAILPVDGGWTAG